MFAICTNQCSTTSSRSQKRSGSIEQDVAKIRCNKVRLALGNSLHGLDGELAHGFHVRALHFEDPCHPRAECTFLPPIEMHSKMVRQRSASLDVRVTRSKLIRQTNNCNPPSLFDVTQTPA